MNFKSLVQSQVQVLYTIHWISGSSILVVTTVPLWRGLCILQTALVINEYHLYLMYSAHILLCSEICRVADWVFGAGVWRGGGERGSVNEVIEISKNNQDNMIMLTSYLITST